MVKNPVSKEYRKSTTRMPIDLMTKETPLLFVIPNKKPINKISKSPNFGKRLTYPTISIAFISPDMNKHFLPCF